MTPFIAAAYWLGPLLKGINFYYLFYAGIFFDLIIRMGWKLALERKAFSFCSGEFLCFSGRLLLFLCGLNLV